MRVFAGWRPDISGEKISPQISRDDLTPPTGSNCNRRGVDLIFSRFPVPEHLWDTVGNATSGHHQAVPRAKPRMTGSPPIRSYFCSCRRHSALATCRMAAKSTWAVMLADGGAACRLRTTAPAKNARTTNKPPPDVSPAGPMLNTHRLPPDTDPAGRRGMVARLRTSPAGGARSAWPCWPGGRLWPWRLSSLVGLIADPVPGGYLLPVGPVVRPVLGGYLRFVGPVVRPGPGG